MGRKPTKGSFSKKEAAHRFEAALRGASIVGSNPPKTMTIKRGRPKLDNDPMPESDSEALIAWGKRNIQRNE